jgi:aspartate/methionine/tyrosine aminotransferase
MRFETIKYIEWAKTRPVVEIDLCSSSVDQLKRKDLDLDWGTLEVSGENSYGYPPLLEAIAERYGVEDNNVVSAIGTSHALFLVCAALIGPGDEVLIESPVYEPLLALPVAFGARVRTLERKYANSYQFTLDEFETAITPHTKFILLTNLHNPSGALLSRSFLARMVRSARQKNIFVVIDEIYLEFTKEEPTAFHLADNVIVISSLTKVFGLANLRCGWVLAQPRLAERMRRIVDYTNVEGTFVGEAIAHRMFIHLDTIKEQNRELVNTNKSLVKELIDREDRLSWVEPAGGVVCFPRVESGMNGDELAECLRDRYGTAVVPGRFFGQPEHFRLGFGGDTNTLEAGLTKIRKALRES